jgi:uncharacterized SAM-binding protein YcdF (DUF218 family)
MYRLIAELVDPFVVCHLILGAALALLWRSKEVPRGRLWVLTFAFLGLLLVCTQPGAYVAAGSLEWAIPPRYDLPEGTQAIVVLGGRVDPANDVRTRPLLGDEGTMRCLKAAQLYREGGPCLVVASGGNPDPTHPGPPCGKAMADFLADVGVARENLMWEGTSRTTYENALETRRLLKPHGIQRIVLVTSATHLKRSERCFQAQGFEVAPRGCCYRATEMTWSPFALLPSAEAAQTTSAAAHEWLGLVWYWMHGRI